jgi:hypothetical protein
MKISLPLAIQDWRAQLLAIVKGWRPSPSYSCRAQLPTFIDRMATLYRSIPTLSSTSHLPHSLSSNSTILIFGLVLPPLNLQRVKLHKFVKSQQRVTHHQLAEGELAIIPPSAFERMLPPPSPPRERLRRRVPRIVSSLRKESPLPSQSSYVNKRPTTLFASLHPMAFQLQHKLLESSTLHIPILRNNTARSHSGTISAPWGPVSYMLYTLTLNFTDVVRVKAMAWRWHLRWHR